MKLSEILKESALDFLDNNVKDSSALDLIKSKGRSALDFLDKGKGRSALDFLDKGTGSSNLDKPKGSSALDFLDDHKPKKEININKSNEISKDISSSPQKKSAIQPSKIQAKSNIPKKKFGESLKQFNIQKILGNTKDQTLKKPKQEFGTKVGFGIGGAAGAVGAGLAAKKLYQKMKAKKQNK